MLQPSMSVDRQEFDDRLTKSDLGGLLQNSRLRVLQTRRPIQERTWRLLDEEFFAQRSDIELRVYGHYGEVCDLSFLRMLRHVRNFSAEDLLEALNVEAICSLRGLRGLSVGIRSLESFEFLRDLDEAALANLALGATKSSKPSLGIIARFKGLQRLYVEGPRKDFEPIAQIGGLRDLTLRSCTPESFSFLKSLQGLHSLDIKLGGGADLSDIVGLKELKYLELWQVRGLADLSPISELTSLQFLFLQSLKHVERLPDLSRLNRLRRIYLESMNGLSDIQPLETASALEELIWVAARSITPAHFAGLLQAGKLKRLAVGFGATGRNNELRAMMKKAGVEEYHHSDFVFA